MNCSLQIEVPSGRAPPRRHPMLSSTSSSSSSPLRFSFLFFSPLQLFLHYQHKMLSRSTLRAAKATQSILPRISTRPQCLTTSTSFTPPNYGRRYVSMYGYTQAKALVYSKYGEPKDVLRYSSLSPSSSLPLCSHPFEAELS